jgi:tRNA nucleotidyltransferase (CCA-adding enzyme)
MKLNENEIQILNTLNSAGHEAYVVGGCVRDDLLDRPIHDVDICTSALPEEIEALFEKSVPTGKAHGTITVLMDHTPYEVTTFRKESDYSDHRHPDTVEFVDDLKEDLARRDFTVNAMAYHPQTGIKDYFEGQKDIKNGLIKAVGNPYERIEEDALRMLRAYRFAAQLHFALDPELKKAIGEKADLMKYVSKERILKELSAILEADPQQIEGVAPLLKPWVPELQACFETSQNSKWHYTDVGHHTIDALLHEQARFGHRPRAEMALLLHDLGKPEAKTTGEDGIDHFKKHQLASAKIARRVLKDFGFSAKEIKNISDLVIHHDDHLKPELKTIYKYRVLLGWDEEMMLDFLALQYGDILAHSNSGQDRIVPWQAFLDFYNQESQNRPLSLKELNIDGNILAKELGLKGKEIGAALDMALEYAFYHPEKNNTEDLLGFLARKNRKEFMKGE